MIIWLRSVGALVVSPWVTMRMFFHVRSHARVLSRSILRVGVAWLMAAAAMALAPNVDAACPNLSISNGLAITTTAYDPYSPTDHTASYYFTLNKTTCKVAAVFRSTSIPSKLVFTSDYALDYILSADGAPSLIAPLNVPYSQAPAARSTTPGRIDFRLTIPRGQMAPPGDYGASISITLYETDDTGKLTSTVLLTKTLTITYTVPSSLSVNIKGDSALTSTTMSLGTLSRGQQSTVEIQARSNRQYQLDVGSQHNGALMLTPAVSGQVWTVPYTATLGGQALNLSSGSSILNQPATHPASDAAYPLVVTVGDTAAKRAGRYEDTITIDIRAVTP